MIIIGICGASGSGKSTLAEEIKKSLTCETQIIGQDCYYRNYSHLPIEARRRINYDEPSVFNYDEMYADVMQLVEGFPIVRKGYDYTLQKRADSDELITPPDAVILEGIHMFYDQRLVDAMALKVYMHVDIDICLLRRIERDILARGRTIESISKQYRETVKPMYEEYVSKYIEKADFAIMHGGKNKTAIDAVSAYISARLLAEKFEKDVQ